MQKIAFFTSKRYKNGSETEVGVRAILLLYFESFFCLFYYGAAMGLLWGYCGVKDLSGACRVLVGYLLGVYGKSNIGGTWVVLRWFCCICLIMSR